MEFNIDDKLSKESKDEAKNVMRIITNNNTHLGLTASISESGEQLEINFGNGTLDGEAVKKLCEDPNRYCQFKFKNGKTTLLVSTN